MCQHLGVKNPLVPGIANAFGGGIAGTGSVCGALVGAVMAIGVKYGRQDSSQPDAKVYALAQDMRRRFESEMVSVNCRELTGFDLSTAEGVKAFYASDVPRKVCSRAVGTAYDEVVKLIGEA